MPQVTSRDLVRFLTQNGFQEDRQTGSHLTLRHRSSALTVTVPMHGGRDLGRGLTRAILRQAGFSVDDYLRLR